jgi:hypothetical protein
MSRPHEIQLRFIRFNSDNDPLTDDVLRIQRVADDSYRIIYTERSCDKAQVDVISLTNQTLLAYLYRMFWLLGLDEDPFESVQLFVPGYPTSLVKAANIKTCVPNMLDIIITNCWNWPSIGAESDTEDLRISTHRFPVEDIDE